MAQTRKKRRRKHRGTQAGTIETPGRTGRPVSAHKRRAARQQTRSQRRQNPFGEDPTWRGSIRRAAFAAVIVAIFIREAPNNLAKPVTRGVLPLRLSAEMS